MKRVTRFFILTVGLVSLFACHKKEHLEYEPKTETGSLQLNMGIKVTMTEAQPNARSVNTDDFIISVYNVQTGVIAQDVNQENAVYRYSTMPEIITLYTGDYYIVASSKDEMPTAEWDSPFYQGVSDTITIKKATLSKVEPIECTQQNVKVTVSYTDNLKKELTDYDVTVYCNDFYLRFDKTTTQAGYFKPEKLRAVLNGRRHDGEEVSKSVEIESVKPGQHQNIEFDIILIGLQLTVNINTDVDILDKDIFIVDPQDTVIYNPGQEEPVPPVPSDDAIIITGRGFDIDQAVEFAVGEEKTVVVDITASNQIYDLWVDIDSEYLTEEFLGSVGLPKKFNLGDLPEQLKEIFGPDGFKLVDREGARGKTSLVFDITSFTKLLFEAGTHNFIIKVTDYKGNELTKTLTLINH